jgi:hypothetical protein
MFVYLVLFGLSVCLSSAKEPVVIPVKSFASKPIRITVDDLPQPYHTVSARKPSTIVSVPETATLFVPDLNFRVTVYRDGMSLPRHMIYTPTGDILVTEMHGNRISILSGDNTSVFADKSNGISSAFGMAFVEVSCIEYFYSINLIIDVLGMVLCG